MKELSERFLREAFEGNSLYSFGDPEIIIGHSLIVRDVTLLIARDVRCNLRLIEVMALLHDIGKAHSADADVLRERHTELGFEVAGEFVAGLGFNSAELEKINGFLKGDMSSLEARIVKDADVIAFFMDGRLQRALKLWGDANGFSDELQRKADKIGGLRFEVSVGIAGEYYDGMVREWGLVGVV